MLRRYTAGEERLLQDESEEPIPDWQTVERQLQSEVPPSPASHTLSAWVAARLPKTLDV